MFKLKRTHYEMRRGYYSSRMFARLKTTLSDIKMIRRRRRDNCPGTGFVKRNSTAGITSGIFRNLSSFSSVATVVI